MKVSLTVQTSQYFMQLMIKSLKFYILVYFYQFSTLYHFILHQLPDTTA